MKWAKTTPLSSPRVSLLLEPPLQKKQPDCFLFVLHRANYIYCSVSAQHTPVYSGGAGSKSPKTLKRLYFPRKFRKFKSLSHIRMSHPAQPRTGQLCRKYIHPPIISHTGEVRCLHRAHRLLKDSTHPGHSLWQKIQEYPLPYHQTAEQQLLSTLQFTPQINLRLF